MAKYVVNSNTRASINTANDTIVLVSQAIMPLKANDTLNTVSQYLLPVKVAVSLILPS
jgi:hypothetical protein